MSTTMPTFGNNPIAPSVSMPTVPSTDLLTFAFESNLGVDPTKPLYIDAEDPTRCLNAVQTKTLVRKLIAGFKAAGLRPGDCVLVILANNFLYSSIYFSIIGAGGIYLGINPASQALELEHILRLGEPKFIITSSDVFPNIEQTSEAHKYPADRVFVLDSKTFPISAASVLPASPPLSRTSSQSSIKREQYTDLVELTQHDEADWIRIHDEATARATPAAMFSTSGTSGLPKAAISSHHAMICQHLSMLQEPSYEVSRLISLPLFHVFAALYAHMYPIRHGQPLYILPRFHIESYTTAVAKFKITDTVLAPPIVHALNRSSLPIKELFDSIRWIGVGGAPIASEHMQQFRSHLHETATLSQVWGMTELGWGMMLHWPEQTCDGSIGRPIPGFEVRLIDSFGSEVLSDNEPGELQVRYDGMMTGYKNQPVHDKRDWYCTGDIMSRSEGKYFVVGRSKELIKVNGFQVAPAELEAVLMSHPCIADAGVIGTLSDDGDTEVPRAYVVRKSAEEGRCPTLSAEEVFSYTKQRLASYKALKGGIFFVDWIPRTASGKIQRFKLAQMDQYRASVTDLLVRNNTLVAEQKREKITDLKAQAEEKRIATRRSSRIAASPMGSGPTSAVTAHKVSIVAGPARRSRTSLVDKMKALEATRVVVDGDQSLL